MEQRGVKEQVCYCYSCNGVRFSVCKWTSNGAFVQPPDEI